MNLIALFARLVRVAFGHDVLPCVVDGNIAIRARRVYLFLPIGRSPPTVKLAISHFGVQFGNQDLRSYSQ